MTDLSSQAVELYEAGRHDELIALAEEAWPFEASDSVPAGLGQLCRFASVAAWDLRNALGDEHRTERAVLEVTSEVQRARSMVAATIEGDREAIAGLLLAPFFGLLDRGHAEEARRVLDCMLVVLPQVLESPEKSLFARLYFEKRAYSFLVEDRLEDALDTYLLALQRCAPGSRGELKVRGALALVRYLLRPRDASVVETSRHELAAISDAAADGGFEDVHRVANANLLLIESGTTIGWTAFEVT